MNAKDRRHSGRVTYPTYIDEAGDEALPTLVYWDDWTDWRDGMRDVSRDRSRVRSVHAQFAEEARKEVATDNAKLKRHETIRRARRTL